MPLGCYRGAVLAIVVYISLLVECQNHVQNDLNCVSWGV